MRRDKALLPLGETTMIEQIAGAVRGAAGNVTLIGPVGRYGHLGLPVIPDEIGNCGPLGGLYTALRVTEAEWNIVVACDMPGVTEAFLKEMIRAAQESGADCLVPETGRKLDPLCAIYHRRLVGAAEAAIHRKLFKMQDFVSTLRIVRWPVPDQFLKALANVNTPAEWSAR
jgi:molybdopterin-guanine dinucleotide biosynthesis protein A